MNRDQVIKRNIFLKSKFNIFKNIYVFYSGDIHLVRQNDEATKAFKTVLESGLNNSNYSKRFSLLLHFEEHQMELDIRYENFKNIF